jgi:hypothetical protein
VLDYLDLSNSSIHWNPSFIGTDHDWKLESLDSFLNLLYSSITHPGEVDSILWTPSSRHGFAVKSFYNMLQSGDHSSFPWKTIWKVKAPPSITFFLMTIAMSRILTADNLITNNQSKPLN